jgi:L-alanine-DL-glutamate epimerase-like enolase superfamily enzyme
MRLTTLEISRVEIPFRVVFKHASAERRQTETVWVEARAATGQVGFGEGCPRSYVTGESLASARRFFARYRDEWIAEIDTLEALLAWARAHRVEIDANPAAWCAVELALLDVLGRALGRSVESLLDLPELAGTFAYTAVVGDGPADAVRELVGRYREAGFRDFKLKLSGDLKRDRAALACFGEAPELRVRADANNLWDSVDGAARHLEALGCPLDAVEEPLTPGDLEGLQALAARLETPIILDESLLRANQIAAPEMGSGRFIVNARVSKLGGLIRSLEVVAAARRRNIPLVVGAQAGETSLLTRAALPVAAYAGALLHAQEGAFGTLLLKRDVCDPPLMFGPGGRLRAPARAPGLAIDCAT